MKRYIAIEKEWRKYSITGTLPFLEVYQLMWDRRIWKVYRLIWDGGSE